MKHYNRDNKVNEAAQYKVDQFTGVIEDLKVSNTKVKTVKDKNYIMTTEGWHIIQADDYLIKDINGNLIPMKPGLFKDIYSEIT